MSVKTAGVGHFQIPTAPAAGTSCTSGAANAYTTTASRASAASVAALNNLSAAQVNTEVDTAIADAALATAVNLATVDTVVDAIQAKTDQLSFTVAGQVDGNIESVNGSAVTGSGTAGDPWKP